MAQPFSYAPLPATATATDTAGNKPCRRLFFSLSLLAFSGFLIYRASVTNVSQIEPGPDRVEPGWASRGPAVGISEKAGSDFLSGHRTAYPWTNDMLQWQRTGFHFQPPRNWMNDPNGPVLYKGWYHLFYQYNCDGVVWGNITWGHAASRDLLHWLHLPVAMLPDRWYDTNGVWTGSATVLPDGNLVMIYTGSTNSTAQVQCLAVPADPEGDPLLIRWRKHEANPVLLPPPSVLPRDFRDPTTAWTDPSDPSTFLLAIGSKDDSAGLHTGVTYVYSTRDFLSFQLLPGVLHAVEGTGMWECVDFFPVSTDDASARFGLDTSERAGERVKHVLKASMDDDRRDYYALGSYDAEANKWAPDDAENDVGIGLRYDWGKFYASKTFYDEDKKRRVLWGWVGEADSERADASKGWASIMSIPRTVVFDSKTASNLLFWPVDEVGSLRAALHEFTSVVAGPGAVVPLRIPLTAKAAQLDIEAEFEVLRPAEAEADVGYNCSTAGGAAGRGVLGPFGLLVLATENLAEQTATYFYLSRSAGGGLQTHFCQDETRSSAASDIEKKVVGSTVPVLYGELLTVRILIDHSIVESFAQGGRSAITSRVYPTKSFKSAKVFLFNNATSASIKAKTIKIWEMDSTFNHIYGDEAQRYT